MTLDKWKSSESENKELKTFSRTRPFYRKLLFLDKRFTVFCHLYINIMSLYWAFSNLINIMVISNKWYYF